MNPNSTPTATKIALLLAILVVSLVTATLASESVGDNTLYLNGYVDYSTHVIVNVDFNSHIGVNKLRLGTQPTYSETVNFPKSAIRKNLLQNASFSLIRVFDYQIGYPAQQPCINWNDTSKTGTFNWAYTDALVQSIFDIGAEPLIVLGFASSTGMSNLPPHMGKNATTGLPNPDNWAPYCSSWVNHFYSIGKPVRFYEIVNEPFAYFGWSPNLPKLAYFGRLYNSTRTRMRALNNNLIISFDHSAQQTILDYLIDNNIQIDSINYHKYDTNILDPDDGNYENDAKVFVDAEREYFTDGYPYVRSVQNAAKYYTSRTGKQVLIINSESNLNGNGNGGSDPRMVQMNGTIWEAMVLRMEILNGVNYHIHFTEEASEGFESNKGLFKGYGYGLVDSDSDTPWYSYWLYYMLGKSLGDGDVLCLTSSSSKNLKTLAWNHEGANNLLLIHSSTNSDIVDLSGFATNNLVYMKLDSEVSFLNSRIQTGKTDSSVTMKGYTVMLLSMSPS